MRALVSEGSFFIIMKRHFPLLLLSLVIACSGSEDHDVHVNNQYAIRLPVTMKPVSYLHEDASLQQEDKSLPLYIVVVDESKEEMEKHELDYNLDLYFENIFLRRITEAFPGASVSQPIKDSLDGLPAIIVDITGRADTVEVYYKAAVIESSSHYYQVFTWTTTAKRSALDPQMKKIIYSFREL
jgi:hypothetical protein